MTAPIVALFDGPVLHYLLDHDDHLALLKQAQASDILRLLATQVLYDELPLTQPAGISSRQSVGSWILKQSRLPVLCSM